MNILNIVQTRDLKHLHIESRALIVKLPLNSYLYIPHLQRWEMYHVVQYQYSCICASYELRTVLSSMFQLHFIFRHKNPKDGSYEEKHAKPPTGNIQSVFDGKKIHLFTLVVRPDNTFEIFVDQESVNSGSLLEDFSPAVNPPKEIEDPEDKKPEDWDEREKIPDPDAEKPDDWDEDAPAKIPDASAKVLFAWTWGGRNCNTVEPHYFEVPRDMKNSLK